MRKIFLVRHGETDWNRQMRFQGRADIPLNDRGKKQARLLARHLSKTRLSAVLASPLSRAWETAKIIAAKHNLNPETVVAFTEIHYGSWEGKIYKEMSAADQAALERWFSDPVTNFIPGGEPLHQFQKRVQQHYAALLKSHHTGNLAVVTHGGVIKILVAEILEISLAMISRLRLVPASLTVILYDDWGNPYLELFNGAGHLQED